MKTPIFITSAITVTALCLLPVWRGHLALAGVAAKESLADEAYYQEKATHYRQEAEQLQSAIQRYELMAEIYQKGSRDHNPGFNPLGRRLMVERTKRVIHYFTQEKHKLEQQAAEQEKLAHAPSAARIQ